MHMQEAEDTSPISREGDLQAAHAISGAHLKRIYTELEGTAVPIEFGHHHLMVVTDQLRELGGRIT